MPRPETVPLLIAGQWTSLSGVPTTPVHNPSSGEVIAETPLGGPREIDQAVQGVEPGRDEAVRVAIVAKQLHAVVGGRKRPDRPFGRIDGAVARSANMSGQATASKAAIGMFLDCMAGKGFAPADGAR